MRPQHLQCLWWDSFLPFTTCLARPLTAKLFHLLQNVFIYCWLLLWGLVQSSSQSSGEHPMVTVSRWWQSLQSSPALLLSLEQPDDAALLFIIFPAGRGWDGQHMRGVMLSPAMTHLSLSPPKNQILILKTQPKPVWFQTQLEMLPLSIPPCSPERDFLSC